MSTLPDPNAVFAAALSAFPKHAKEIHQIIDIIVQEQISPLPRDVVITLRANGDLGAALTALADGQKLVLSPNSTYTLPAKTVVVTANNASVCGTNTTIIRPSVAGSTTAIAVRGENFSITGVTFDSDKPLASFGNAKVSVNAIRAYAAGLKLLHCVARNIDDLVLLERTASGAKITSCRSTEELRGDMVYVAGTTNVDIDDLTSVGSTNEHCIRVEVANDLNSANTAANISITNSNLTNHNGKETIAIRYAAGPVLVDNCSLGAWMRAGQVAPAGQPAPTNTVNGLTVSNCHFTNRAYLQIDQGVTNMLVCKNAFDNYTSYRAIHVQGPHVNVHVSDNVMHILDPQSANASLILAYGLSPNDVVIESGTTRQ